MRVSLARAMVTDPKLLLLDEPFAALDEITRRALGEDVHVLWAASRAAIVFVTHNVEEACYMAGRVVVMTPGPGRFAGETIVDGPLPRPPGFRTTAGFREACESTISHRSRPRHARRSGMNRIAHLLAPFVLVVVLLAVWEAVCRLLAVPVYLLPAPSEVAVAAWQNAGMLIDAAANTLSMAILAFVVASLIACGVALLISTNPLAERAVQPLAVTLQVTPIMAIAPLAVIWAGLDHPARAVVGLAAIVAFFPIFSGAITGLKSADPDLERLFDLYEACRATFDTGSFACAPALGRAFPA